MEGFVYSPLNTYTYNNSKSRQQNYSRKSYPPGTVEAVEYLDNYKRAQLKAILSQVNPNLTPRLRKANTKEIGIQVNPKVDASVQCSLGPRTLPRQKRRAASEGAAPSARSLSPGAAADAGGDPEAGGVQPRSPAVVRFSRPVAVYSPVFDRCLVEENQEQGKPEDWESGFPLLERPKAAALLPETGGLDTAQEKEEDREKAEQRDSPETRAGEGSQKFRFQFLEQKYGYYHCKDCNIRWESAYVWCISGTNKVYFKQFCRKCDNGYNPYRVEAILCQTCFKTRCTCTQKKRHIDPKRPHRQELCGRCRGKRLSCDNTYSFKYIV
ncbi:zygote arrest protein 1-like isoform X1 [Carcharodon carcharias]|uniref:zygote arrest protein 1-like isoform X1 n=1 Tax=Carcharodon carcharias TaxID=13397 RepID=UPI001B7E5907|nr:zygote arrest protein 1-like isoform X1 [Carcharodon carcharias]